MKQFLIDNAYRQFYVADRVMEPEAPTQWHDSDIAARHLAEESIVALCPSGEFIAKVFSCGPQDPEPGFPDDPDFEVRVWIRVPSKRVGIFGWPWELMAQYELDSSDCVIRFQGFAIDKIESEEDYYLVQIK